MATVRPVPRHLKALTTGQISRLCSVAPRTVSGWIDRGYLEGYRIPGSNDRRVSPVALLEFMRSRNMSADMIQRAEKFIGGGYPVVTLGFTPSQIQVCKDLGITSHHAQTEWELGYLMGIVNVSRVVIDLSIGTAEANRAANAIRALGKFDGVNIYAVGESSSERWLIDPVFKRLLSPAEWPEFLSHESGEPHAALPNAKDGLGTTGR